MESSVEIVNIVFKLHDGIFLTQMCDVQDGVCRGNVIKVCDFQEGHYHAIVIEVCGEQERAFGNSGNDGGR